MVGKKSRKITEILTHNEMEKKFFLTHTKTRDEFQRVKTVRNWFEFAKNATLVPSVVPS